jgi:hypothetical protein
VGCISLGFSIVGVDYVVSNFALFLELYLFWGLISLVLHLIGLFLFKTLITLPLANLTDAKPEDPSLPEGEATSVEKPNTSIFTIDNSKQVYCCLCYIIFN